MAESEKIMNALKHLYQEVKTLKNTPSSSPKPPAPEWKTNSDEVDKIIPAILQFQAELKAYQKTNSAGKGQYAPLEEILSHLKDPLLNAKLFVEQATDWFEGEMFVVTTVWHTSGQWLRGRYAFATPNREEWIKMGGFMRDYNKEIGGTYTYIKRYAIQSILGITAGMQDDIDNPVETNTHNKGNTWQNKK